jgi:putative endonuclease
MKPWYLYMLECVGGSIYTGITTDVDARYAAHQAGKGAKYTRANPPTSILKIVECENRSEASKFECKVKKLPTEAKRRFISGELLFQD